MPTLPKFWMDHFISNMVETKSSSGTAVLCPHCHSGKFCIDYACHNIIFEIFRRKVDVLPTNADYVSELDLDLVWNSFESAVEWIIFSFQVIVLFFTQCKLQTVDFVYWNYFISDLFVANIHKGRFPKKHL